VPVVEVWPHAIAAIASAVRESFVSIVRFVTSVH
jgi:hypothetical protein